MTFRSKSAWCRALALTAVGAACGGKSPTPSPTETGAGGSSGGSSPSAGAAVTAGGGNAGMAGAGSGLKGGDGGGSEVSAVAGAGAPEAGAGGADSPDCTSSLSDVQAYASGLWDPLGYPPYALDGCRLVYVAAGSTPGALVLRDLTTGSETQLEAAEHHPRRPSLAGSVIAWESDAATGSQVRVLDDGEAEPFATSFEMAAEPRATGDAVVFTAFVGAPPNGDTNVLLYDLTTRQLTTVAGGAAQQRFADVSATHVAVTDFAESAKGYFDETDAEAVADIVVIERSSLQQTRRESAGKQAFPMLGDSGRLAYLAWGAVHPEPKFSQFRLMVGRIDEPVSVDRNVKGGAELVYTDPAYVRPSLRGHFLDYIDAAAASGGPSSLPQLFRVDLSGSASPSAVTVPGSGKLLGPVAQSSLTLVARPVPGATSLGLVTVAR
jgi:hypothetical protein